MPGVRDPPFKVKQTARMSTGNYGTGRTSSQYRGVTFLRAARNRQWQAQLWAGNGRVRLQGLI